MEYSKEKIDTINNGILNLYNFYNGFIDETGKPVIFHTAIQELFELYKTNYQYKEDENYHFLVEVAMEILEFEYAIDKSKMWYLEGTDSEPTNLWKFNKEYCKAYNVCMDVHCYFVNLKPADFYSDDDIKYSFDGIIYKNTKPKPTPKPNKTEETNHFTRHFTPDEQKKLYDGLIDGRFISKETIYSHFCHVLGILIPDNEAPFEPLIWQKSVGLLAYCIDNLFSDTDGKNLWETTANCFLWKGKKPNKDTMKNTVSRYKTDTRQKPKGYETLDAIISL
jgi:hypothetical protein